LDHLRNDLIKEHNPWQEYSHNLKDYVERRVEAERQNNAPPAKQEASQSSGLFGGLFGGGSAAPAPKVHVNLPTKPNNTIKKLPGLYIYGGPGSKKLFENIWEYLI